MINSNIFEAIKQATDCLDLARELGLDTSRSGAALCIFHAEDTPSLHIYADGFKCFGCGEAGSVIDLFMRARGVDLITASRELAARAGLAWPERNEEARQEYETKLSRQAAMQQRVAAWTKTLRPENIGYLKSRGFTEAFIVEHGFGYCVEKLPTDADMARKLGLLTKIADGRDWYMPSGRLTVSFWRYGRVVQVAFHESGGKPKYLYPAGWPKPLLVSAKPGEKPFLVEGVFDYYSLLQAGLPAACGLGTQLSGEQKAELVRVKEFYICFDGDEAGRKAAAELAKEFYPAAKMVNLPDGEDVNDILRELGVEAFKSFMLDAATLAKDYLELQLDKLGGNPSDAQARALAIACIAKLPSDIDRDARIDSLAKILKPCGIGKAAVRADVARLRKQSQGEGQQAEPVKDAQYTADFTGLVDICETDGNPCFLVMAEGKLVELAEYESETGTRFCPPLREQMPWLLADAGAVRRAYLEPDAALYHDLREHFAGVSEMPEEGYYSLLAWWTMHSYLYQQGEYSPYMWFYAVPERGKSRTGKAIIYLAWRGVHVESLRDAYLVRIAHNFKASLFFDCMDLWAKAEKQGTEDILLQRFERGAVVPRVNNPDRGAFRDTDYYSVYGPTIIATNETVHIALESRTVQITMPQSSRRFDTDIRPEDALKLKARLTAFRARHMSSVLPVVDKPAAGRLGDIMRPLLQMVKLVSPEEEGAFLALLAEIEEARKLDKSGGKDALTVQAVLSLMDDVSSGLLAVKLITDRYNEGLKERQQITSQGMGHRLKALGFKKHKMRDGKMAILYDDALLEKLCSNYSLADTTKSLRHLRHANKPNDGGRLDDGGFPEMTEALHETTKSLRHMNPITTGLPGHDGDDGGFSGCADVSPARETSGGTGDVCDAKKQTFSNAVVDMKDVII